MKKIALNGTYKLRYYEPGTFSVLETENPGFFPEDWMDTFVPEDVRTALSRNGYLDGYYYGKDLDKERWIDEKDWVYWKTFFVPREWKDQPAFLSFAGIDTLAKVWLNGTLLGSTRNMFREYRFPVTDLLKPEGPNTLVVQVLSPVKALESVSREGIYPQEDTTRMLLRKSQMNWGWDFCGHCLTVGIWKPVTLELEDCASLENIRLTTESLEDSGAELHFSCDVFRQKEPCTLTVELTEENRTAFYRELPAENANSFRFRIPEPRLWWPRPYGEPFLYGVRVCLKEAGKVLDEKCFRFGIRTTRLIQQQEDGGRSFRFRINGRDLFIRGANWVPLNCVYTEITDRQYDEAMERILDSNLSMLRIWGGGIYESEHFLDLCDENGIMIFQDMMLACGIFPQDEAFLREVEEETREIVRKNYNRTSIVIWSADNELDEAYRWYDMLDQFPTNRVNRVAVRKGVESEDSSRPFLVSSPCSPFTGEKGDDDPNSDAQGDMHLYLTRFRQGDEYYYKRILEYKPRFMSEYGFSSLPVLSSYERFNFYRGELDLTRNPWLAQLDWLDALGKTGDRNQIIYYSQFTHAEGLKYWIEYLRSLKWHCGGSLYWKFNDPVAPNRENMLFPSLMSSVDFYGEPKLAYYYARRAYADRILAFREDLQGNLAVYGCSECREPVSGRLEVRLCRYSGETVWEQNMQCTVPADASEQLLKLGKDRLSVRNPEECYVAAEFTGEGERLHNLFHLTEIGSWDRVKLGTARLQAFLVRTGPGDYTLRISADRFAKDVRIDFLSEIIYYTDNGFDLENQEIRTVRARLHSPEGPVLCVRVSAANAEPLCCRFAPERMNHEIQIM